MKKTLSIVLVIIILLIQMSYSRFVYAHDGETVSRGHYPKGGIAGNHNADNYRNFLKEKSPSKFLGIKGRDYFQLSASAITILTVKADNDPNIDPALTTSKIDLSSNIGYELSYRIGFDFDNPFRTELEYSFWNISMDEATEEPKKVEDSEDSYIRNNIPISGYVRGHSFSINTFYTYAPGGNFHSYFGGGAGISKITTEIEKGGTDGTISPHIQGFIGVEYLLDQNKKIALGYKARMIIDPDLGIFKEAIIKHAMEIGFRFYFN